MSSTAQLRNDDQSCVDLAQKPNRPALSLLLDGLALPVFRGRARRGPRKSQQRVPFGFAQGRPSALFGMTWVNFRVGLRGAEAPLFHGCAGDGGNFGGRKGKVKGEINVKGSGRSLH